MILGTNNIMYKLTYHRISNICRCACIVTGKKVLIVQLYFSAFCYEFYVLVEIRYALIRAFIIIIIIIIIII